MYTGTMFGLLVDTNIQIADCSIEELFRNNKKTSGITVTAGFVFPLLCTDILYSILLYKIHLILKRRQSYIGKANMDSKNSCGTKSLNLDSYKFSSSKKAEGSYSKRGGIIHKQSPQEKQAAFEDEEINLECINVDNDNDDLHSDDINQLDLYDNDLNKQLHKDYTEDDNVSFPNLDLTSCIKETEKSKKTSTQDENSSGTQNKMARNSEKLRQVNKNSRKTLAGSSTRHGYRSAYTSEEIRRIKRQDNAQLLIYGGKSNDNQKQSINLIGVVLFMINLSIFIPLIVSSTANFNSSFKISKMTRQILVLIVMNNALFDPWAYAFQSREFRHALVENMGQLLSIVRK